MSKKILSVFKRMDRHEKRLDDQEDDIQELEGAVLANSSSVKNAERFFGLLLARVHPLLFIW